MSCRRFSQQFTVFALLLVPLATPALFVLALGPTADGANAEELAPKQAYSAPTRTNDAPPKGVSVPKRPSDSRLRAIETTETPEKKPGKLGFTPHSQASRGREAARSAANAVVRRHVPNPPVSIARKQPISPSRSRTQPAATLAPAESAQIAANRETPRAPATAEMELVMETPAAEPSAMSEMPLPPLPEINSPAVVDESQVLRTGEPNAEMPARKPGADVVQLFFDDEPSDDDPEDMEMEAELDNPVLPVAESEEPRDDSTPVMEVIQSVAAQADSKAEPAGVNAGSDAEPVPVPTLDPAILADLTPVRSIEIRKAVQVPPLAEKDDPKLLQPTDQALTVLRGRRPLHFWPIYREPWLAHRDSYPFFHNPLWFEDPNLERCGRGWGHFTTAVSAVHFAANIPILPYRMTAEKSCCLVRTLPDCQVCEQFGYDAYLPPWSWRAAAVQAAATTGFIYAIP